MRLIVDEQLPKAIAQGLRRRAADVVTVVDVGSLWPTTAAQRADEEARIVVSHDEDFLRLHAGGAEHEAIDTFVNNNYPKSAKSLGGRTFCGGCVDSTERNDGKGF